MNQAKPLANKRAERDPDQPADADSTTPPARTSWEGVYWKSALLLLVALLGCFRLSNADIWWHLRTGELILERGQVPDTDWFTYTNPDAPWIDLHWGFQVVVACLHSVAGVPALILFKSLIATMTFAICLTIGRKTWPAWQSVVLWLAPLLIFAGRYYVRPEILSLCFLACTLAILHHSIERPKLLWLLPPLQILWVNVQGLFVLQFVVMGCWLIERLVGALVPKLLAARGASVTEIAAKNLLAFKQTLVVIAVTGAASFVNPYGYRGVLFPLELLTKVSGGERQFFYQFAGELEGFQSLYQRGGMAIFSDLTPLLMLLMTIAIVVSFLVLYLSGKGISIYRLMLFLGFTYLTWQMSRNSTLFAIVGGMVLRLNLGELLPTVGQNTSPIRIAKAVVAACLGLLILSVPTNVYSQLRPSFIPRSFGFGMADWYPTAACEFVHDHRDRLPDRVYAWHIGLAAPAIYHLGPEKKVFADARLEMNTRETLESYLKVIYYLTTAEHLTDRELMHDPATGVMDRTELPVLLFDTDTLIDSAMVGDPLTPNLIEGRRWRCLFIDPAAAVFVSEEYARQQTLGGADVSFLQNLLNQRRYRAAQFLN